ncbi:MAG: SdiA-regulated domain-containing protein [Lutibacter sp.]|nr:SdiA-regulated domain-containing protein [Lutibacter sp.]
MKNLLFFVFIASFLVSCTSKVSSQNKLKPIKTVPLNIPEPSGITVFNNRLFIVSDYNGIIYKTTLEGKILHKIKTKFTDLEGITIDESSQNFWIVSERDRALVALDSLGNFIKKFNVKGKQKYKNSGLEGICFVESEKMLYVVNEKLPTQLLQLNLNGEIINKFMLDLGKDLSGICFDINSDSFWVVSDESEAIYNIDKKGALIKDYKIPVKKAEGIVIYNNKIYIVSDSLNSLFVFELPD